MSLAARVVSGFLLCMTAGTAFAQDYQEVIRGAGIDGRMFYDETPEAPRPNPEDTLRSVERIEISSLILSVLVVAGVGLMIYYFGGRVVVTGKRREDGDVALSEGLTPTASLAEPPPELRAIVGDLNRDHALVNLGRLAISKAADRHGLRIRQSWTIRDALRRMPKDWDHTNALQRLGRACEGVIFGGYAVSEDEFQNHLADVGPIVRDAR